MPSKAEAIDRRRRVAAQQVDATADERALPEGAPRRLDIETLPDHLERLYRAAYALCGRREDAEDLVQETFERVLRRPRFLRGCNDGAYLMRVLRNAHLARETSRRRRPVTVVSSEDLDWVTQGMTDDSAILEVRAAFAAIHQLSQPQREAIVAVDVIGLTYKQAARALGAREGTIISRAFRGRQRLATMMDREAAR